MSKHWIAMSGMRGYLPDFCCACDTLEEAVDTLGELHELTIPQRKSLRRVGLVDLHESQGGGIVEVMDCECEDMEVHNDC